jgi:two-component system, sensor histidine kinase RegB
MEPRTSNPPEINFPWLIRLRWRAALSQLLLILGVHFWVGIRLPLGPLLGLSAAVGASNLALEFWRRRGRPLGEVAIWAVMALDVVILTALLHLSGGPFNPFTVFYLVNVVLAAIILPQRWTWALGALAAAGFGALFALADRGVVHHAEQMQMHLQGMWVAFVLAAAYIVYFVHRLNQALAAGEALLARARDRTAQHQKLAALATLAAGAAHELSTPLSTIAVVAKELERGLARAQAGGGAVEDARLIREQTERCRSILVRMAASAGESAGEPSVAVALEAVVARALEGLGGDQRAQVRVQLAPELQALVLEVPQGALAQALENVVRNALQASPADEQVVIRAERCEGGVRLDVLDLGPGLSQEAAARASEPFFTTRPPGSGMGLGLFLTRSLLDSLGGTLALARAEGMTRASLWLPPRCVRPAGA